MMKTTPNEHWSVELIRIGNSAVREAQRRNRQLGIPNWYSLNGVLVSDAPREVKAVARRPIPAAVTWLGSPRSGTSSPPV
ncbi:MAG: hypothetical protein JSR83_11160 [Proteobacteria bacterium]|nr:hypothetical protein [Pseudomonadota bacterium]